MDAIEALDWAVYSHFDYQNQILPAFRPLWQAAYYAGFVGFGIFLLIAALLFLRQGKRRSTLVVLLTGAAAIGVMAAVRFMVPRQRPPKAGNWLGPENMIGSYPSAGVFLFMLAAILLGFAIWKVLPRVWLRIVYVLVATGLTVWIAISQFFLAIHFLTDVIGAMAGAALIALVAYRFLERQRNEQPSTQ
jgi:membrane-associated phospholipid phosphatase